VPQTAVRVTLPAELLKRTPDLGLPGTVTCEQCVPGPVTDVRHDLYPLQ
jgi:hypothetical protein